MKTKAIILVACLLAATTLKAQNFEWAKSLGGLLYDSGYSISVDASGNVYTTGRFFLTVDFDPGEGISNLTSEGSYDNFVQKMDASGNFLWAKSFGGPDDETSYSISLDAFANVYTTGSFHGTVDFDPGEGITNLTSEGWRDIYIQKMDASGNFLWAKSFGGTDVDWGASICLDASANVYTIGRFEESADFDPGTGTTTLTSAGEGDIFVQKMDASGNFLWAKSFGGTYNDSGLSISIDASGNIYTTGFFRGTADFDPGTGTTTLTSAGGSDIFIQKMDASGNFLWAMSFGGTGEDSSRSTSVDASGNVYTTGSFFGTVDFDPGTGTTTLTSEGSLDIFVQKMDASGNFLWAKSFGSSDWDHGFSISVGASGNVYNTGAFSGTVDFDPDAGTTNLTSEGTQDVYVQKMDASGNFLWAKSFGGIYSEFGNSICIDAPGNVYTTGYFQNTVDFDPGAGTTTLTSEGQIDVFVHKMSQTPVGIVENTFGEGLKVYPNPTNGNVSLDLGKEYETSWIKITDITGKLIYSKSFTQAQMINFSIEKPSGVYFMRINSGDKKAVIKLMKE